MGQFDSRRREYVQNWENGSKVKKSKILTSFLYSIEIINSWPPFLLNRRGATRKVPSAKYFLWFGGICSTIMLTVACDANRWKAYFPLSITESRYSGRWLSKVLPYLFRILRLFFNLSEISSSVSGRLGYFLSRSR